MRVLMVCSTFPGPRKRRCGVGDYTQKLVEYLQKGGIDVAVFDAVSTEKVLFSAQEQACSLIHWQYHPRTYGEKLGGYLLGIRNRRAPGRLPFLATMHTVRDAHLDSLLRSMFARIGADHLLFTNQYDARKATIPLLLPGRKRTVCPVGPTIEPSPSADRDRRAEFGFPSDSFLISSFGFLNRGKGVPHLLQAMLRVRQRVKNAFLALIGEIRDESRPLEQEMRSLAKELGLEDCIRWLGDLSDEEVSKLLVSSDVYVLSFAEGVSTKRTTLMCGLAHGTPLITTRSKDKAFPLRCGQQLECVPRNDPEALAQRIVDLSANPQRREALGKAALASAGEFSWERIAQDHIRLYQHLVQEAR